MPKTMTTRRLLLATIRLLEAPQRLAEGVRHRIVRLDCTIDKSAFLFPESALLNLMGRKESIIIGAHTRIRGECRTYNPSGSITIGSYCYIGSHSRIWSAAQVIVGDRVAISDFVNIHDNDSHPLSALKRHRQMREIFFGGRNPMDAVHMAPVVIEDDVWIGFGASVSKGVRIGRGAIIGAGAFVIKDVPAFAIVAGNPARQVGVVPTEGEEE